MQNRWYDIRDILRCWGVNGETAEMSDCIGQRYLMLVWQIWIEGVQCVQIFLITALLVCGKSYLLSIGRASKIVQHIVRYEYEFDEYN